MKQNYSKLLYAGLLLPGIVFADTAPIEEKAPATKMDFSGFIDGY